MDSSTFRGVGDFKETLAQKDLTRVVTIANGMSTISTSEDRVVANIQRWMREAKKTRMAMLESDTTAAGQLEYKREFGEKTTIEYGYLAELSRNKIKLLVIITNLIKQNLP